jgi:hypothetical protein
MTLIETGVLPTVRGSLGSEQNDSQELGGYVWMVDRRSSTVVRCLCLESSPTELRLRVPRGYGVGVGQRYEVQPHLPGQRPTPGFGMIGSARVTIVEARILLDEEDNHLYVRAVRFPLAWALRCTTWPRGLSTSPAVG